MPAPYLESERLYYKALSLENCTPEYVSWLNDAEVIRYMDTPAGYTLENLRDYLADVEKQPDLLFWAIYIKEGNKHIGNIKIDPVYMQHYRGEYGIMMGARDEWGKGYAREATQRVIDYLFEEKNLYKVTLGVIEDNIKAVELYKKLGFVTEGHYINHGIYDGKLCSQLQMAIFNPNHKEIRAYR